MTIRKGRLTVTVDTDFIEAGNSAVQAGSADSLSAWVNDALAAQVVREGRLAVLDAALGAYESEFGVITDDERAAQERADRESAVVVRSPSARRASSGRPGRSTDRTRPRSGAA